MLKEWNKPAVLSLVIVIANITIIQFVMNSVDVFILNHDIFGINYIKPDVFDYIFFAIYFLALILAIIAIIQIRKTGQKGTYLAWLTIFAPFLYIIIGIFTFNMDG